MKPRNPVVVCKDGTFLSVQASNFHYSIPRDDNGPYTHVEVGFPSVTPSWWSDYGDSNIAVAGYVPVKKVQSFIAEHGGIASGTFP